MISMLRFDTRSGLLHLILFKNKNIFFIDTNIIYNNALIVVVAYPLP